MDLGTGLEQRGQHLPQPVGVEVAQELSLVRNGDLAELLAEDQDDGVGLHREAKPGTVAGSHPLAHCPFLGQGQDAAGGKDLVPADDDGAIVEW
jgi:hypothetical protein